MKARSNRLQAGSRPLIALVLVGLVFALLLHGSVRAQPMLAQLGHWMLRPGSTIMTIPTSTELREIETIRTVRAILQSRTSSLSASQRDRLASYLVRWSYAEQLDPLASLALIQIESDFNPQAMSPVGAAGLLQLIPYVAQDLADRMGYHWTVTTRRVGLDVPFEELPDHGEVSLLNPEVSLRLGLRYLAELKAAFPAPVNYYAAYNLGPTLLRSRLQNNQPPRGEYYRKVLAAQRQFELQRLALTARGNGWQISHDHTVSGDMQSMVVDGPAGALFSR